jgi:hypothetical protein
VLVVLRKRSFFTAELNVIEAKLEITEVIIRDLVSEISFFA